jgi:hypothetical protein
MKKPKKMKALKPAKFKMPKIKTRTYITRNKNGSTTRTVSTKIGNRTSSVTIGPKGTKRRNTFKGILGIFRS